MRKQFSFVRFMTSVIKGLESDERFTTAKVYAAALRAALACDGGKELYVGAPTARWLKRFENYLRKLQRQWNTISTYIRMLRATYNRAAAQGLVQFDPFLFRGIYTGVRHEHKQALTPEEMHRLVYVAPCAPLTAAETESREWLKMMFQLQGMPFIDFARLQHSDFDPAKRLLTCHRKKTGTPLAISLTAPMMEWIEQHRNPSTSASPYLLNILSGEMEGADADAEYQCCLRRFNRNLDKVAKVQGLRAHVSSYTARHTWATLAKSKGIPTSLISDALGHTSVKTTEIYLKSFDNSSLKRANSKVIACVQKVVTA